MTVAVCRILNDDPVHVVVPLRRPLPDTLALGAMLRTSVCVITGDCAYLSQSTGNLDNAENIALFEDRITSMIMATGAKPRIVAHDLHPDFHSTLHAASLGLPTVAIQHHHAHIAALLAEHHVEAPVIGLALDGYGLGTDNKSWGGELLLVHGSESRRLGHLKTLLQPGGDVAAREPWRMAAAVLHRLGRGAEVADRFRGLRGAEGLAEMMAKGVNCPPTSSAGRLFDAACGLLGVHPIAEYEGQAPMKLESMTMEPKVMADGWRVTSDNVLDLTPLLERLLECNPRTGAELFHGTLAAALAAWAAHAAAIHGTDRVALGGGCFLNRALTDRLVLMLKDRGLKPLTAHRVSPDDSGLSLGQAWAAAQTLLGH
ncbi:MAG: carbamoyltransferase HypF [Alphaproteobacteria bacterium]|nr:carbamoyltransferase HypF [Alphaproteobacteria bacterium]